MDQQWQRPEVTEVSVVSDAAGGGGAPGDQAGNQSSTSIPS